MPQKDTNKSIFDLVADMPALLSALHNADQMMLDAAAGKSEVYFVKINFI